MAVNKKNKKIHKPVYNFRSTRTKTRNSILDNSVKR